MFDIDPTKVIIYAVAIVAILLFIVWGFVALERRVRWFFRSLFSRDDIDRRAVRKTWKKFEELMRGGNLSDMREAVLSADSLLDEIFKSKHMIGKTMGARLKYALHRYPELRFIWRPHRLRNQLVHEHDLRIKPSQLRGAFRDYKKALRILSAL